MLITNNNSIIESLKADQVIPDVLDEFSPQVSITVKFNDFYAQYGNGVELKAVQQCPQVQFTVIGESSPNGYVLVMTDPDAPSRTDHKWSEYCHWVVDDVKPDEVIDGGNGIIDFMPSGPPPKTGPHRYVFVILAKSGPVGGVKDRPNWGYGTPATGLREWARECGLTVVGANFYVTQSPDQ